MGLLCTCFPLADSGMFYVKFVTRNWHVLPHTPHAKSLVNDKIILMSSTALIHFSTQYLVWWINCLTLSISIPYIENNTYTWEFILLIGYHLRTSVAGMKMYTLLSCTFSESNVVRWSMSTCSVGLVFCKTCMVSMKHTTVTCTLQARDVYLNNTW